MPSATWSAIPPTAEPMTGRPFHIPSATVSPNPSARLFCTMTVACRCNALTMAAFSSMSSSGSVTSKIRARAAGRQVAPLQQALTVDRRALRVIAHLGDRRADQHQVPLPAGRDMVGEAPHDPGHVLEPVPPGHLDQHRITGAGTALADDGRWPGDDALLAVAAHEPRRHRVGAAPSSTPSVTRMARTVSGSSGWFFGENGSIDGGMIQAFSAGIHGGT